MFGTILKAINSYFGKGMTFCRSIYVKKVMKLLAFIFEQPSYYALESEIENIQPSCLYSHSKTTGLPRMSYTMGCLPVHEYNP